MFSNNNFENDECIIIDHRENICTVCCKNYIHHNRYIAGGNGFKELELVTAHAGCRGLIRQQHELIHGSEMADGGRLFFLKSDKLSDRNPNGFLFSIM